MIFYFSGTGNSSYVAERIAKAENDKAISIENFDSNIELKENEVFGIVTPVNWFELPVLIREFLTNTKIKINKENYSFIVTTYGTTPGCTYSDAKKILSKKGIKLGAGFSVKMPDNWTPMFDLSNPKKVRTQLEEAEKYIDSVLENIRNRRIGNLMENKLPYIIRLFSDPLLNSERKTKRFYIEETCVGCGLCAKNCPVQAISIQNQKPVWIKKQCALCLRCLHNCPKFAIQYGNGKTKEHGQYKNPH